MILEQSTIIAFIQRHTWVTAIIVTSLFFLLFNIIATPLLNSGDDAFIMYPMSGGYGAPPTNLLHYHHGWHYWLGGLGSMLFANFPGINWYSVILVTAHFWGVVLILVVFLQRLPALLALCYFGLVFFFTEAWLLESLTYTGAAITAATGGCLFLLHRFSLEGTRVLHILPAFILLVIAGLLRMHIAWMICFAFSVAGIIALQRYGRIRFFAVVALLIGVLALLYLLHSNYYTRHIPRWKAQDEYRNTLIKIFNHPIDPRPGEGVFINERQRAFFNAGLYYDSTVFTQTDLDRIQIGLTRKRLFNKPEDLGVLKSTWMQSRKHILFLGFLLGTLWISGRRAEARRWMLMILPNLLILGFLFVFMKITPPILMGLFLVTFCLPVLVFRKQVPVFNAGKGVTWLLGVLCAIQLAWIGYKLVGQQKFNRANLLRFRCAAETLKANPDKLFVSADDSFPIAYFYAWDRPANYPLGNMIYKNWWLSNGYPGITSRFGIEGSDSALLSNPRVFIEGRHTGGLEFYFQGGKLTDTIPGYKCLEVRQLVNRTNE